MRQAVTTPTEIGHIEALFRYPVKSMRGERLESVELGWHGVQGDRRFALRKVEDKGGFPWLTASKVPELLLFTPHGSEDGGLPTLVRTPEGRDLPIFGDELAREVERRFGAPLQMMQLKHGIFDEGLVSVIATDTTDELTRLAGQESDVRRFRPNIVVRLVQSGPFQEDGWVGGALSFGDGDDAPTVAVTLRDERCSMINFDPDTAGSAPEMMKAAVRANGNHAGVYGTVTRTGRLAVGQKIVLLPAQ